MRKTTATINLFEYQNKVHYPDALTDLERFLDGIWNKRGTTSLNYPEISEEEIFDPDLATSQKFISIHKGNYIKSRKYVGIIRFNNCTINLLPKIFHDVSQEFSEDDVAAIQANVLWWLSYCRKFKFPKLETTLSSIKSDFFEVMIYLFATYTRNVLNNLLYHNYQEIGNDVPFMKGRLDVNAYISNNLINARWHKLSCIYDSFEFDNQFNRIVKYVSKLLLSASGDFDNKKLLSEIVFILEDVSDVQVSYSDCQKVHVNPMFDDLTTVLDYCRLFLSNSVTYSYKNDFKVFAFLVPMEYVFEDFIFGFMEEHLRNLDGIKKLKSQKSDLFLASLFENDKCVSDKVFNLKHDIYFEYHDRKIIVDTKYKIAYWADGAKYDMKYGVAQSDLYQLVSYAIRRRSNELYLVYPETLSQFKSERATESVKFQVSDRFVESKQDGLIEVSIVKVPVIHNNFPHINATWKLEKNFEESEHILKDRLLSGIHLET